MAQYRSKSKAKKVPIKYTSREFDSIKRDLLEHAKRYYPDTYKDFNEASFGSLMIDTVAYIGDILSFYLDYQVNESYIDTAVEYNNIIRLSRQTGYKYKANPSSYGTVAIYALIPASTSGLGPDTAYYPVLKKGSELSSKSGNTFILDEDVRFDDPSNEIVAARTDTDTGLPTFYAVRAYGRVVSGIFGSEDITIGSFERFIGILLENTTGRLPLWLAPVQIVVASITTNMDNYINEVVSSFKNAGLRCAVDNRNEKINYKVREHSLSKIPIIAVVGDKEIKTRSINIRRLGQKDSLTMSLDDAITELSLEATPPDIKESQNKLSKLEIWKSNLGKEVIESILKLNQITIASLRGYCLGGAACIASACDFRVASKTTLVAYPEIDLGMNLNWFGLPLLLRLIGPSKTKRMVISGDMENADTLFNWGFIDELLKDDDLEKKTTEFAKKFASKPALPAQMIKRSVNALTYQSDQSIMHMDYDQFLLSREFFKD